MPLFKYFVVVGSILLGLLFLANAVLSSPDRPVYASRFDQTPPDWLDRADGHVMSTSLAPEAPHIAEVPLEAAETTGSAAPVVAAATPRKVEIKKKKPRLARRQTEPQPWADPDPWNAYAYARPDRRTERPQPWFR